MGVRELSRSNIYGAGAASVAELFGDYLEGDASPENCIAFALGLRQPSDAARDAICKSLSALGYGPGAATFASLEPRDPEVEGGDIALDERAVFMLIEGLDPLFVITVDDTATRLVGQAYRCAFETDSAIRVFGRPSVSFANLDALLSTDAGKQRAWRLFKSIPKRS